MLDFELIGNLGQDAVVRETNGRKFVSLSVSHNESYVKEDGTRVDNLEWVSCTWDGDGGRLLQYLKKGQKVFVRGRGAARLYSSEKERRLVAGLNIAVRQIELLGGAPDGVPRYLFDRDGVQHVVWKYFNVQDAKDTSLFDMGGREYLVDANGWVSPTQASTQQAEDAAAATADPAQSGQEPDPAAPSPAGGKSNKKNNGKKKNDKTESEYDGF